MEIHLDIVAAQRVFLQLKRALEKIVEIEGPFLRRSGRENSRRFWTMRAARRAWRCVSSSWRFVESSAPRRSRKKLGNAEDGSKGIIQLMGDPGKHLSHGGEFLRLDELFL